MGPRPPLRHRAGRPRDRRGADRRAGARAPRSAPHRAPVRMTRGALYVVGTRSFAAEVVEYATAAGFDLAGLLEPYDRDRVGTEIHGLPVTWLEEAGRVAAAVGT